MMDRTPQEDEYNYYDDYWRCGRNYGCGQAAGWGTHHVGVGACKLHGGAADNRGEKNGNYKHGAWSQYADYDEDVVETVESIESDLDVLEELRDERLAQYYTILEYLNESEGVEVAGRILDQLQSGDGEVDSDLIGRLARVMQVSSQSMDNLVARIQSLSNDLADRRGDDPRQFEEKRTYDEGQLDDLRSDIKAAFGGSDEN